MNILIYISNTSNGGGTERAAITIANYLAEQSDHKILIATSYGKKDKFIFQISSRIELIYLDIQGRPILNLFSINRKIYALINRFQIDALISNEVMSIFFTLPAVKFGVRKVKLIVWDHFNFNVTLGKSGRQVARKLSARFADIVVVLTDRDKCYWEIKLQPKSKIICIPNPSPFFNPDNPYNASSRVVIAVGHLLPVKGFDMLIDIWKNLKDNYPINGWQQLIIGNGSEKENLEQKIIDYKLEDFVHVIPATNQIERYYKNAAFIVMTSHTEGLPMTLIEAQSFGLPIISFVDDVTMYGVAEIANKGTGFLVPQYDIRRFADDMWSLMQDNAYRLECSINAYEASERYNLKLISLAWLSLFM